MRTCYLGVDDGYFDISFKRSPVGRKTVLAGAITCNDRFENLFLDLVTVDGLDATTAIHRIIEKASALYTIEAVFLDGVTYAGFNIADPRRLYRVSGIPVIVIFRHRLDLEKIRSALEKHFHDYRYRFEVIESVYSRSSEVLLGHLPTTVYVYSIGVNLDTAKSLVLRLCRIFAEPYPLRIADKVASVIGRIVARADVLNAKPC